MIRCILFDLDGVLFDSRSWHQDTFLRALQEIYPLEEITQEYHYQVLDGLSTKQKLCALTTTHGLPLDIHETIAVRKQEYTNSILSERIVRSDKLIRVCEYIKKLGLKILCVSNSIGKTTHYALEKLGIYEYFEHIVTNEATPRPKPAPDMYLYAFEKAKILPYEALILEDSIYGRTAAYMSGAHVLPIVDSIDVTLEKIVSAIESCNAHIPLEKYGQSVHIVVPMAGYGSRFAKAGYTVPKPYIPIFGKPMIQYVIENMFPRKETYGDVTLPMLIRPIFHFIVQVQHIEKYSLSELCDTLNIEYTITTVSGVTEGSACSILLAEKYITTNEPVVSVNSDQWIDWNPNEFYRALLNPTYDGCISTFYQPNPHDTKWSYSRADPVSGVVTRVVEKEVISEWATTGVYGWKRGSDFVGYIHRMIAKNIRVNGEFYTAPSYNEAIQDGKRIRNISCKKMWGLGVPEDLDKFLDHYKCEQQLYM